MLLFRLRAILVLLAAGPVLAQPAPPGADTPAPAGPQRVDVTGARPTDTEERRRSTAAKIVVGREEIERYGDSSVGELLKRLPGVTVQGTPGRGGTPRMRGLGSGYTQILVDGERVPAGFSIDSLSPEQIERIEVLRAPTAETGARAIAGTINIVMREGFRKRLNDLRIGTGIENGEYQPGVSWTRNDTLGPLIYNFSLSAYRSERASQEAQSIERAADPASGIAALSQIETSERLDVRQGIHATGRLQWRSEAGDTLTLSPLLIHSESDGRRHARLTQAVGADPAPFDIQDTDSGGSFTQMRLNLHWAHRLADGTRLEWRGAAGEAHWKGHLQRPAFSAAGGALRTFLETSDNRERNASVGLKASKLLEGDHSLVGGIEAETSRRNDDRTTLLDGSPVLTDFGDNVQASVQRTALYAQDEWNLTPHWAAHAGLRWEAITTRGQAQNDAAPRNRSHVLTPLLHAVWKPDPKGRDQVRVSLTRSYRSPTLGQIVGRPWINNRFPLPGTNLRTSPDRAGNPSLRPELATGIDIAFERYLPGGGLLSANLFHRSIRDLMRSVAALETVSGANQPRWVSRPQNIGDAVTQGLELEAKFRLSDWWPEAPAVDVRANGSLYRSRVKSVPGPDNRLDQQPSATANLGADYRLRGLPLTVGGNLNLTPGYTTRLDDDQVAIHGRKRVVDAYVLWAIKPGLQLRVSANNLAPEDQFSVSSVDGESTRNDSRTYVNWGVRLEMKL